MIARDSKYAGLTELEIFERFQIDYTLPKYEEPKTKEIADPTVPQMDGSSFVVTNQTFGTGGTGDSVAIWGNNANPISVPSEGWSVGNNDYKKKVNWFIRLFRRIILYFAKKKHYENIYDFFMDFQGKVQDLNVVEEMANYYEEALTQAKESHQVALEERIKDLIDVYKYETLLFAMRLTKFVTEAQVCDFYEMKAGSDKALQLTWIKNFTRLIPSDVMEVKRKVDEQKIFDNYVVLHYDKQGNSSKMTKREKEIKKDPILFGVLAKSRKLYYIADWKDEYCDLTLDGMFSELGENVLKINNKSVKSYISTGSDKRNRSFKRKKV